uniref:Uncharacterized protein n=1 Tax=Arundo donax TaxID=35708 RepID=A0A0A9B6V7_ARUDO
MMLETRNEVESSDFQYSGQALTTIYEQVHQLNEGSAYCKQT